MTPGSGPATSVLVLVENDDEAEMIGRLLAARGMEVDLANDVASVLAHLPGSSVGVVVLSLRLGRDGGLGALAKIRRLEDGSAAATPVVLLADATTSLDRLRAWEGGADAILTKVFAFDDLVAAVNDVTLRSTVDRQRARTAGVEAERRARAAERTSSAPRS